VGVKSGRAAGGKQDRGQKDLKELEEAVGGGGGSEEGNCGLIKRERNFVGGGGKEQRGSKRTFGCLGGGEGGEES